VSTEECRRLGLQALVIQTETQVEQLRLIRNTCKDGFSHDNDVITPEAQQAWWLRLKLYGDVQAWLYYIIENDYGSIVGYGLLRRDDSKWYSSVAVLPEYAGRGYGGAITADLVRRSDEPVYATARIDNPAACKLHREADWAETHRDDRLVYFLTRPHIHLSTSIEEWAKHGWCLT
jgi:RimJ/RimL family protein N-acetyltransferase